MARKLSAACLALAALLAVGSITAAAEEEEFRYLHFHKKHVILTGEQITPQVFKMPGGINIECREFTLAGTEEATSEHVTAGKPTTYTTKAGTVHPEYRICKTAGIINATVGTGECHFNLTYETDVKGHALPDIECKGGAIEIKAGLGCIISIPTQQPAEKGIHYTNNEGPETEKRDVILTATIAGISFKANPACVNGFGLPKEGKNAEYEGEATLRAFEDTSTSPTETGVYEEGPQTGLWVGPTS